MRPFDVQITAGLALRDGRLAEMKTGEGKTLAAVIPAALLAREWGHCHILTFNDYLAARDAGWMRPFYERAGLTVGVVQADSTPKERARAYRCDITYSTAKEAGFDFLRDNLVFQPEKRVHSVLGAVIVDEADSILIDEARIPLVIAGDREGSGIDVSLIARKILQLDQAEHFEVDQDGRNVNLTDSGLARIEDLLGQRELHAEANYPLLTEVNQALHARALLIRDVDYLVRDEKIALVDELTGRVVPDRRWPDGLQAALEAKEGLPVRHGGRILGSITLLQFLDRYTHRAGMTATAQPASEELKVGYGMTVVPIPENKPCLRTDQPDLIFATIEDKETALLSEIETLHGRGQPVLVGTTSVSESVRLGKALTQRGVHNHVLNAKNDSDEASIVAQAGDLGAVTVSTNMAGRGTDIRLGGASQSRRDQVVALGGLRVLGTNRHESRRIDDQLRGRAGRQGDPGSSRFYVSLGDPIMRRYGIDKLVPEAVRVGLSRGPTSNRLVRSEVERIQRIAIGQNREIRSTTARYTAILGQQRMIVSEWRRKVLEGLDRPEALAVFSDLGEDRSRELTRVLYLASIDERWADHLALVSEIREGIHLVRLGGQDPLFEFHKQTSEAFGKFRSDVTERVARLAPETDPNSPPQPSSTWTYLVNDGTSGGLHDLLFGAGSSATLATRRPQKRPLLRIWAFMERRKTRV